MKRWNEIKIENSDQSLFVRNCVKPAEIRYSIRRGVYAMHHGSRVYLNEIMSLHNKVHMPSPPGYMAGFDGYTSDSYSSGLLVKIDSSYESIRIYSFYIGDSEQWD